MWPITILSLIGAYLNINKNKACFIIWTFTNFAWMAYDFSIKAYAQCGLFFIYFCLAIWGLFKWNKKQDERIFSDGVLFRKEGSPYRIICKRDKSLNAK